jgi:RNA polymerase sigma-70 factor (sigma-E family)
MTEERVAWTQATALADLYRDHYRQLLRLAALLLDEPTACEDVAQEAFIRVFGRMARVEDPDATLAYLRQTVVNVARSGLRRRQVMGRHPDPAPKAEREPEEAGVAALEHQAIVTAMRTLPRRQREAIVLRYYAELSEAETATALGVSVGSVKSFTSRGLAALESQLEGLR